MKNMLIILLFVLLSGSVTGSDYNNQLKNIQGPVPEDKPLLLMPGLFHMINNYRDVAISPDGKEFYFAAINKNGMTLMVTRCEEGRWSVPQVCRFSGKNSDFEPVMSFDGQRLYFCSNRPTRNKRDMTKDVDIWFVKREGKNWGVPRPVPGLVNTVCMEYFPSLTFGGKMYFGRNNLAMTRGDIHAAELVDGRYQRGIKLPPAVNFPGTSYNAFVSPDESYMIFSSYIAGKKGAHSDMFVSFRDSNGKWTKGVNLGKEINSDGHDHAPLVSFNGKYMFFSSTRGRRADQYRIYWVSTSFLDKLRKDVMEKKTAAEANLP